MRRHPERQDRGDFGLVDGDSFGPPGPIPVTSSYSTRTWWFREREEQCCPAWTYLDSTVTIPYNTWTHVAGTYNGSVLRIVVNGVRAGSLAVSGTTCHNDRPLAVGAKNFPAEGLLEAFWDGQLDDVRLYRRALTDAEIRGLVAG